CRMHHHPPPPSQSSCCSRILLCPAPTAVRKACLGLTVGRASNQSTLRWGSSPAPTGGNTRFFNYTGAADALRRCLSSPAPPASLQLNPAYLHPHGRGQTSPGLIQGIIARRSLPTCSTGWLRSFSFWALNHGKPFS